MTTIILINPWSNAIVHADVADPVGNYYAHANLVGNVEPGDLTECLPYYGMARCAS